MCRDENFELPHDVDLAFLTIHGTFGEDGQLQKILEDRGVAYTGDGIKESRIAFRQNPLEGEISRKQCNDAILAGSGSRVSIRRFPCQSW
jgi:hypothetical protein